MTQTQIESLAVFVYQIKFRSTLFVHDGKNVSQQRHHSSIVCLINSIFLNTDMLALLQESVWWWEAQLRCDALLCLFFMSLRRIYVKLYFLSPACQFTPSNRILPGNRPPKPQTEMMDSLIFSFCSNCQVCDHIAAHCMFTFTSLDWDILTHN